MVRRPLLAHLVGAVACAACLLSASAQPFSSAQGGQWTEVSSLAALPPDLRQALGAGRMADRDEEFNSSCVVDPSVPSRRFVIGALNTERAVVAIERGGRALQVNTLEYVNVSGTWRLERRGHGNAHIRSSGELMEEHNRSALLIVQAASAAH